MACHPNYEKRRLHFPSLKTGAAPAPQSFDLTRLLVLRDRLPWFWFAFTVAVLLLSAIDRYHIISQFKQRERVVIIDPAGTYYLSPLLQFSGGEAIARPAGGAGDDGLPRTQSRRTLTIPTCSNCCF